MIIEPGAVPSPVGFSHWLWGEGTETREIGFNVPDDTREEQEKELAWLARILLG